MKTKTKKRIAGVVSLLCIAAMLLTGTFAWQDFRQHSSNLFEALDKPDVRLNDEFKPPANWNTTVNSLVDKKVSVSNTQNSSAPVFVRLRFSEYMETFVVDYSTFIKDGDAPVLFATYASGENIGEFMSWDSEQACKDGLTELGLNYIPYEVDHDADVATPNRWFARTQNEELQNGVYGKPMNDPASVKKDKDKRVHLYGGVEKQALVQDVHDQTKLNETPYKVHTWNGMSISHTEYVQNEDEIIANPETPEKKDFYAPIVEGEGKPQKDTISDFIDWNMGSGLKTYAQWVKDGKRPENTWVLATDGWCYWANFLPVATTTSNILESIQLVKMPGDAFDYEIHIDMQAITEDELGKKEGGKYLVWEDMGEDMRTNLVNTVPVMTRLNKLQAMITELESLDEALYTPRSWKQMKLVLAEAILLTKDPDVTAKALDDQIAALKTASEGLVLKADKSRLTDLVAIVEALPTDSYTSASLAGLHEPLIQAKALLGDVNAQQTDVDKAYDVLLTAKKALKSLNERAALKAAIAEARIYNKADWSTETWDKFNTALLAAITTERTTDASIEEIDTAKKNLTDAQAALRADKTKLTALCTTVEAYEPSKHGVDAITWQPVADLLDEAIIVMNNPASKQSEVYKAWKDLKNTFCFMPKSNCTYVMDNREEWRVLKVENGEALIISEDIIEVAQFNSNYPYPTWQNSPIRSRINSKAFLAAHFTNEERARIVTTDVSTATSLSNTTLIITQDQLFLLDKSEATSLFATNDDRVAKYNGVESVWWLRNPDHDTGRAGIVTHTGEYSHNAIVINYGVRPAMWMTI